MSVRQETAQRIADFINEHGINAPFGGEVNQSADKRYYSTLCSYPRTLDGLIRTYSPKFILIQLQGPMVQGDWQAVYESEEDALRFLQFALVDHDLDLAEKVPHKEKS